MTTNYLNNFAPLVHPDIINIFELSEQEEDKLFFFEKAIFGQTNTKTKESVKKIINNGKVNFPLMYIACEMVNSGIDKNLIHNYISSYDLNFDTKINHYESVNRETISTLLHFYNEKRTVKLLLTAIDFISDTIHSLKTLIKHNEFVPMKKPKSIYQLHENASELTSKVKIGNLALSQREDILKLHNMSLSSDMIIKVPNTHYELVHLGESLNFCIGNGYYTDQIMKGKCSIVSVCKANGKPLYGIQFTRYAIHQAYGFGNTELPDNILYELEELLLAKPSLPDDFIPFEHSFMAGYKYDNNNLYILFKKYDSVYMYENVPNDVYDEFMMAESKGSYFASFIRNSYNTSKMN